MKKFFAIFVIGGFLISCNSNSENKNATGSDSATVAPVTTDSVLINSDSASSKMNPTTTTDTAK